MKFHLDYNRTNAFEFDLFNNAENYKRFNNSIFKYTIFILFCLTFYFILN